MNFAKKIFYSVFLSFLLISLMIFTANATLEEEYEFEEYYRGSRNFAFKIKLVIETEEDGTWYIGSTYEVHLFLIVTYFNDTHFGGDPLNFSATEYEGKYVIVEGDASYHIAEMAPYRLYSTPITERMAKMNFYPETGQRRRVAIYPVINIEDIDLHHGILYDGTWGGDDVAPTYITVQSPPSEVYPLFGSIQDWILLGAGILIGAVVVGAV
ncbi:MAG: hypothetical protein JSV57_03950, partial [Candidatus Bathyarchaeota archaeon]